MLRLHRRIRRRLSQSELVCPCAPVRRYPNSNLERTWNMQHGPAKVNRLESESSSKRAVQKIKWSLGSIVRRRDPRRPRQSSAAESYQVVFTPIRMFGNIVTIDTIVTRLALSVLTPRRLRRWVVLFLRS